MKVAIVGPIATADVAHLLGRAAATAPGGYDGAPILATLIDPHGAGMTAVRAGLHAAGHCQVARGDPLRHPASTRAWH
jgi:hypothetical protein